MRAYTFVKDQRAANDFRAPQMMHHQQFRETMWFLWKNQKGMKLI